jgi:hypothetical protein
VDSGADNNFIDQKFVHEAQIPTLLLDKPVTLQLADGSKSQITKTTAHLKLRIGSHSETIQFLVTNLSRPAILGCSWLKANNPNIDWKSNCLNFLGNIAVPKLSEAVYPNFKETLTSGTVPLNLPLLLYQQFQEVFSKGKALELPPHRPNFDFQVNLQPNAVPPFSKNYNLTGEEKMEMKKWIQTNLEQGFIRRSHSPYAAPCFFISKKDGDLRLCMDYRKLNSITIKTRYPLPLISEIIKTVSKGKLFTALDLRGAYNRLRVYPGHEERLAFVTNFGQYEFLVMPFGPSDAPGYFQSWMNQLFGHLQFVCVYLDDIIIFSDSNEAHSGHLKIVFQILLNNQLFCKLEKCKFFTTSISYLGYVITTSGISMDPQKLSAIHSWPEPKNKKELQSFLGFTNFYRRFIPHYSELCKDFTILLTKNALFSWNDSMVTAFKVFKSAFATAISLYHPDDHLPFEVECDCSDFALGAILSQRQDDGSIRPISFYARQLNTAERNYPIYDKELLAVHEAFQEWRHYLQNGNEAIIVWSDHQSLSYFMTTKQLTRRHARWSLFFSSFNFVIKPRPGSANLQADALSRRPDFVPLNRDNTFSLLSPDLFLPAVTLSALTTLPIATMHARMGHPGSKALNRTISAIPEFKTTGILASAPCESCARGKSKRRSFGRVSSRKYELLEVLSADIQYFSTKSNDGTSTNVKIIDHYSKYLKTFLLPDRKAATLLQELAPYVARMERQTGKSIKFIRTDQGGEFDGVVLDFLASKGIVRQKTTPYYHIDPGLAEHAHQTVLYTARSILIASNLPLLFYGDAILTATYLHNRIVHTGFTKTPYELCKGRPPRVDHLRPFGCIAYVHIPAETRSKLAPAAIKCRLVGYGDDDDVEEIRGYKFISETDISYVIYSSDARFDESTTPSPLAGYPSFDFSTQGADIFGDPTYSDSEDEEGDGV